MKKLYAMVSTDCNLHCPHCNIPRNGDGWNEEKFLNELLPFEGNVVLFGGEPTVHRDRFYHVVDQLFGMGKYNSCSITTNLIDVDEKLLEYLTMINYVGTSWNKTRFTPKEYVEWVRNLHRIDEEDIHWSVLVTLTPDLIERPAREFINTVYTWGKFRSCTGITLEHLVFDDADEAYYQRADEWMCDLYKLWNLAIPVTTFWDLKWWFDCSETYTLLPNGEVMHCCPTGLEACKNVPNSCMVCDKVNECRPCVLQTGCSYPHKLYELIKEDYERYERYSQK